MIGGFPSRSTMNREQLKKTVGQKLRLRPQAWGSGGEKTDDDWALALHPKDDVATLTNLVTGASVKVGFDHIHSYSTDPARGSEFGFLSMLSQIQTTSAGQTIAEPIPPRPVGSAPPQLTPLVVQDGTTAWRLTWRGRDPVHLLPEDTPKQLLGSYKVVCDALRRETGKEPQFDKPDDIRHEIVWGLSPDHHSKHRLLGGMDGQPAQQVLVLTHHPPNWGRTYTGAEATAMVRGRAIGKRLAERREYGVDFLQNRIVNSTADQDALDLDRRRWVEEVVTMLMEAQCPPSEVSQVRRLGTYTPKQLPELLDAAELPADERALLVTRNKKHRNEMAERLERLLKVIKTLERGS